MATKPLGTCPECGAEIRASQVLIEYETGESTGRFADCLSCGDVVDPQ